MGSGDEAWCELGFGEAAPARYTSPRQVARILTEGWVGLHGFCPACAADQLDPLPNNSPAGDFRCAACGEEYELKAKRGAPGAKIVDGAYETMLGRVAAANNPSLFVMGYDPAAHRVTDLIVVPRHFFTAALIEPKAETWPRGRSAPWRGCNILIGQVPDAGRIPLIRAGVRTPRAEVRDRWGASLFLRDAGQSARGWLIEVMKAVEDIDRPEFTLAEVYAFEPRLAALYPGNHNVRPKIRQQLQVLRDAGWLEFVRPGVYRRR